ncbi:MAG TPA: hypothetical protein VMW47_12225 [Verrucomicrobiae bacterium]|nr:hypothetical protein [Verrucomicrobiae bacterium]
MPTTAPDPRGEADDDAGLAPVVDRWLVTQARLERRFSDALGGRLRRHLASVTLLELDAITQLPADGLTPEQLGASLGLAEAESRKLVTRLVRRRMLRREGRERRVVTGPRGDEILTAIRQAQAELLHDLFARLPAQKRDQILDVSASILRASRALRDETRAPSGGSA